MHPEPVDILLADDSADDTAFVLHALKMAGVSPDLRAARDGAEALDLLLGDEAAGMPPLLRPRLVILDLKLPKVDGLEVLRRLRASPAAGAIPVVVWSSSQEKRDLAESYRLGANSFLVKPMDAGEFADSVRTLVNYWLEYNQLPTS